LGLIFIAGKAYLRGRISTVDLLVLTSLDEVLFNLKLYFPFFTKTTYLNEEVNCTDPFPSVRLPCSMLHFAALLRHTVKCASLQQRHYLGHIKVGILPTEKNVINV
jgi:hypothetical protein